MAQQSLDLTAAALRGYSFQGGSDEVFAPTAVVQPVPQDYSWKKLSISVDFLHCEDDCPCKLQFPVIPSAMEGDDTIQKLLDMNSHTSKANTHLSQYVYGIAW